MIWPWSEIERWKKRSEFLQRCLDNSIKTETFDRAIRRLDTLQAELTIHPEGCPEPWRSWLVEAHEAMCQVIEKYMEEQG